MEFYLLVIIMQWRVYLRGERGARGDSSVWYERNCRDWDLESESLSSCRLQRSVAESGNDDEVMKYYLTIQISFDCIVPLRVICLVIVYLPCMYIARYRDGAVPFLHVSGRLWLDVP